MGSTSLAHHMLTLGVLCLAIWTLCQDSVLETVPPLRMTKDERAHVLSSFEATAPPASNTTDTVWAHRAYAPMYIHRPSVASYRTSIERAFPSHVVAFDVCFAAADIPVPWHTDWDSLGPFDASLASIAREDFITVHTNLLSPENGGGQLRTLDSLAVAAVHFVANQMTNSFGALARLTEPLAAALGVREHDTIPGVGNAFNNLKAHEVTAGRGRISYVVRLVRKDVLLSADKVRAAASGASGTRRIREFEHFLPLLHGASKVAAGSFPWSDVNLDQ